MKKILLFSLFLASLSACVVPINTSFESARMLDAGESELLGHYSHYRASNEGDSDGVNNNFGVRFGYGLTQNIDLKARYIRLVPVEEGASGVNYVEVAPKFGLLPGRIAGTVPFGLYFAEDDSEFVISPKLLFTYPASNQFEATVAAKADIFPGQ